MRRVYEQIVRVAATGGDGVHHRRERHRQGGRRADGPRPEPPPRQRPFLAVNCGAISPNLIESELFGHEKGSFTGADRQHRASSSAPHGGTLFLDEITEMPLDLQVKLLRVLETRTVLRVGSTRSRRPTCAIIAATNRNPNEAVAARQAARGPALSPERVSDPPAAAARAHRRHAAARRALPGPDQRARRGGQDLSPAALERLATYRWPGNVRELRNVI